MFSELVDLVRRRQPHLLGISVSYGTYSLLNALVPELRKVLPAESMIAYGGALATYLSRQLLTEIDPQGVVVVGEGERSLAALLERDDDRRSLVEIDNLVFVEQVTNRVKATLRREVPTESLGAPYREHLRSLVPQGIQLYVEASRGCSWSHCTFCLRKLLDIKGQPDEFRLLPMQRLIADLNRLHTIGASSVTFADEDFLGTSVGHARAVTGGLAEFAKEGLGLSFDASMRIQSVLGTEHGEDQENHHELLSRLKQCGLRKVFLGIESGSNSQLRRYAKGHSAAEASVAIQKLRQLGIQIELGWIMFDPLCSLTEIRENIQFLFDNDAVDATSSLFSELRLQAGTPYMRLIQNAQGTHQSPLITSSLDPDTLSVAYR